MPGLDQQWEELRKTEEMIHRIDKLINEKFPELVAAETVEDSEATVTATDTSSASVSNATKT